MADDPVVKAIGSNFENFRFTNLMGIGRDAGYEDTPRENTRAPKLRLPNYQKRSQTRVNKRSS